MRTIPYTSEDLLHHHAIAAIIQNEQGEILMQEHVKYGFWTIPIGKVKQGQQIEEALREELFEECDVHVEKWKEIVAKDYHYVRNEKPVTVSGHLFEIFAYNGIVKNKEPDKHLVQVFLSLEKIKQLPHLSDMTLLFLETRGIHRAKSI